MAFGKIYADNIENSVGATLDLTQVVTTDATTSAKGYMSATDKTKLDGIEAGAEVNAVTSVNGSTGAVTVQGFSGDYDDLTNKPTIPSSANDLSDIDLTNVQNGSVLKYNSVGSKFTAVSAPTAEGTDETASVSTSTTTATSTYDSNNGISDGYNTYWHTSAALPDAAFEAWWAGLQASGVGTAVTVTNTNGSSVTWNATGFSVPFQSSGFLMIQIDGTGIGSFELGLDTVSYSGTSYAVTLTGSQNPIFDTTKQVTVNGTVYSPGDWTVSGTTATKTFGVNPSLGSSTSVFQTPSLTYDFEGTTYAVANATVATSSVDGLMSAANKEMVDGFRVDESTLFSDAETLARYDATATGSGSKDNNFIAARESLQQNVTVLDNNNFNTNVVIGYRLCGEDIPSGTTHSAYTENVVIGADSVRRYAGAQRVVAIGQEALEGNASGSTGDMQSLQDVVAIGYRAGLKMSGDDNVFIGSDAGNSTGGTGTNITAIGYQAGSGASPSGGISGSTSNVICLGNNNVTDIYCADTSISSSDGRDKTDVEDFTPGLSFVQALRPVTYRWDKRSFYLSGDLDSGESVMDITPDGTHKKERLNLGFIAQEVEQVEKDHGFSNDKNDRLICSMNEEESAMGIKYERLVPVLVNAIQELSDKNDALLARIEALEQA